VQVRVKCTNARELGEVCSEYERKRGEEDSERKGDAVESPESKVEAGDGPATSAAASALVRDVASDIRHGRDVAELVGEFLTTSDASASDYVAGYNVERLGLRDFFVDVGDHEEN